VPPTAGPGPRAALHRLSIVIPVKGGAAELRQQLDAVSAQRTEHEWEIVVADNGGGSTGSPAATAQAVDAARTASPGLAIRWVDAAARPGSAAARNIGATYARGDALIFCDADDLVEPGWLAALADALSDAEVAAGGFDFVRLAENPSAPGGTALASLEPQFAYLPAGLGANLAVRQATFEALGGFDETLPAGEDVDLCWRAQKNGARFSYAPAAVVAKRARVGSRALAAQSWRYGRSDARLFRRHRPDGMPRALPIALKTWAWLLLYAPRAIANPTIRALWVRSAALRCGRLVGSLQERVFYP
jgi:GT2 family glycosyltransferase